MHDLLNHDLQGVFFIYVLKSLVYDFAMSKVKLSSILSGVAGEYLTVGELSRRGYIASITLRNSKGVDILVTNEQASKSVAIQVKTSYGNSTTWMCGDKAEDYYADNLFYVFVNLNNGGAPSYYIVPSKEVAVFSKEFHKQWLATPGRKGQKHKDNRMRKFIDQERKYLDRWDLLGL